MNPIDELNVVVRDVSMSDSTMTSGMYYELEKLKNNYDKDVLYMGKLHSIIGDISNNLLNSVERDLNHKKKEQDIQDYYNKQYQQQIFLLKLVIFFSVIALGGCLLFNLGLISVHLLTFYLGFVLSVAFMFIFYYLWDFFLRDNTRFDEYDFATYLPPKVSYLDKQKNMGGLGDLRDNIIYC